MNFEIDNIIILDNDKEYLIVDTIEFNSKKYVYLSALQRKHFVVARVDNIDGQIGLSKLDEDEYQKVLEQFLIKNKDLIEKIEIEN